MKISLIAPPFVEIPPEEYGGTERILQYLGNSLIKKGLDLTLYTAGDSKTEIPKRIICDVALFNDPSYNHVRDRTRKMKEINKRTLSLIDPLSDLVNCHDYDNPDLIDRLSGIGLPILVSIRHAINPLIKEIYGKFKDHQDIYFHGLSKKQLQSLDPTLPYIHNGIDPTEYEALLDNTQKRDYFLSIGDTKPIKGHKIAIELAKTSGLALVVAGAPYYPESHPYFKENVVPNINVDVSDQQERFLEQIVMGTYAFEPGEIIYFGSASSTQKKILFKYASFMQFLGNLEIEGNIEACSLTCPESLMSGTAVLGVRGSITEELIEEGETGFNISSLTEAEEKMREIRFLKPSGIRTIAIEKFSSDIMANNYIKLYTEILEQRKHGNN